MEYLRNKMHTPQPKQKKIEIITLSLCEIRINHKETLTILAQIILLVPFLVPRQG